MLIIYAPCNVDSVTSTEIYSSQSTIWIRPEAQVSTLPDYVMYFDGIESVAIGSSCFIEWICNP